MVSSVIKVCPKAEELSVVRVNIPCPVDGCSSILPHAGSLRIHLSKTHRIAEESDGAHTENGSADDYSHNVVKQYHCPVQSCVYNVSSKRHFASKKLLKQHYMKIHADKKHKCPKCGQGFGLDRDCRRHLTTCGLIFRCNTCDCPFSSVEAMVNHCHLKQHEIPAECKNLRSMKATSTNLTPTIIIFHTAPPSTPATQPSLKVISTSTTTSLLRPLLPKPIINTTLIPSPKSIVGSGSGTGSPTQILQSYEKSDPLESKSVSIQTDSQLDDTVISFPYHGSSDHHYKRTEWSPTNVQTDCTLFGNQNRKIGKRVSKDAVYALNRFTSSTGIQTAVSVPPVKKKSLHNMVGTQTMGDYILTTAMSSAQIPIQRVSQGSQANPRSKSRRNQRMESSHTQTTEVRAPRWKKRRRSSTRQEDIDGLHNHENTQNLLLLKGRGTSGELTDNHTQTNMSHGAPAISTQTNMTCLMNSWTTNGKTTSEPNSYSSQQSTQTQTISSVLQKMMSKNLNSFYQMSASYNQLESDSERLSFASLNNTNNKSALVSGMESTMQTEPAMALLYSPLSNENDSAINKQVSHNAYQPFTSGLNQDVDDSNCANLLNTIADHHTDNNYVCEDAVIQPHTDRSQSAVTIENERLTTPESNTASPFSFINQSLDNNDCSLPSFPSSRNHDNPLNRFPNLQNMANQQSEDSQRNNEEHAANLLSSLVDKDPILYSSTGFPDIGDSSDALKYPQMESFDNVHHFVSAATSSLDIGESLLLTFGKRISTTDTSSSADNYLLRPTLAGNKLSVQNSNISNLSSKSFFNSALESTVAQETNAQSDKNYMNSSMNTETSFPTEEFYLNNSNVSPVQCNPSDISQKLFSNEKSVGTDPCINHVLSSTAISFYRPSDVLNSSEGQTSCNCMNDIIEDTRNRIQLENRLTLSNAECSSLISRQFTLVADTEVQTLALDSDFEALLNNPEHSRSSSVMDMHTQTVEDMLDLFGNNMETQTAVDDTFFPGLEFSDIETQTTSGDLDSLESRCLITAGTQTTLSNLNLNRDIEFSDMETQTGFTICDLDTFLTDSHTQTTFGELEDFLCGFNSEV